MTCQQLAAQRKQCRRGEGESTHRVVFALLHGHVQHFLRQLLQRWVAAVEERAERFVPQRVANLTLRMSEKQYLRDEIMLAVHTKY